MIQNHYHKTLSLTLSQKTAYHNTFSMLALESYFVFFMNKHLTTYMLQLKTLNHNTL